MCFTKELSIKTFIFGLISSFLLIIYGNKESKNTNIVIGIFIIFVSLMQLIEYFIWVDLDCNKGLNKISLLLGPILNHLQPIIIFILCNIYLKSNNIIQPKLMYLLIIIYLIYIIERYYNYVKENKNKCIGTNSSGHLDWPWKYNFNYIFYFIIEIIILTNYTNNFNIILFYSVSYVLFFLSMFKFKKNIGELWCFMVPGTPLINLILQKSFNINN